MTATWPRERPAGGDRALMKADPQDFQVEELAGFEAEGAGEHLYLRLEKTGLTTPDVARWLAGSYRVPESAVGYAGMKDKHAVTTQWFSVHTPADAAALPECRGICVRAATRHRRKLRRGQLTGNRFCLRLRDVRGEGWAAALASLADCGVPNYFGPQRFGGDNLERARAWLGERRRRRGRNFRSGLYLSVLRSFLFNEVLGVRVNEGTWNRMLPGDVASESGVAPTGPLWGRGRSATRCDALARERAALAPHQALCHALEHAGLKQQRRSLVLKPAELAWEAQAQTLELAFVLPPGGYATTLLGGIFDLEVPGRP